MVDNFRQANTVKVIGKDVGARMLYVMISHTMRILMCDSHMQKMLQVNYY